MADLSYGGPGGDAGMLQLARSRSTSPGSTSSSVSVVSYDVRARSGKDKTGLFMDSTISKDDTLGKAAEELALLGKLIEQLNAGDLTLNSSKNGQRGRRRDRSGSLTSVSSVEEVVREHPPPARRGPPPRMPRLKEPRNLPPAPLPPLPPGLIHLSRRAKVLETAEWRQSILRIRNALESMENYASGSGTEIANISDSKDPLASDVRNVKASELVHAEGVTTSDDDDSEIKRQPNSTTKGISSSQIAALDHAVGAAAVISRTSSPNSDRASRSKRAGKKVARRRKEKESVEDASASSSSFESGRGSTSSPMEHAENNRKTAPDTLAGALSVLGTRYLDIDLLDKTHDTPRFVGYLLDTIQLLEKQVAYHMAPEPISPKAPPVETKPVEEPIVDLSPRWQVFHRVYCATESHYHHMRLYEDEPKWTSPNPGGIQILQGMKPIHNMVSYLSINRQICFAVIKEYTCTPYQKLRHVIFISPNQNRISTSERRERIHIISARLNRAMAKVAEFQTHDEIEGHPTELNEEMDAPYNFLFHHQTKLADLAREDPESAEVISPLLVFLEKHYKAEYDHATALFSRGMVTAQHIGKLFKPNQMVVSLPDKRLHREFLEAYILKWYVTIDKEKVTLRGWSWEYDGWELRRKPWTGKIDVSTNEEVAIATLPVQPVEFAKDEHIQKLRARGQKFWGMKSQALTSYTGWDKNHDHYYIDARFMVDTSTYQKMYYGGRKKGRIPFWEDNPFVLGDDSMTKWDLWPVTINCKEDLNQEQVMLLPPTTFGFNLQEKKWVTLDLECFRPIEWNKKAFDRLVLDGKTKELIYALVDAQASGDGNMDDVITGKGNGLIVLLHGSPGTGKTLTAESVAEIAEKPLYRVTCGDIGTEASAVEKYLKTVLYLGKIWDCVLLLDEADVFLEERTMADLQRNSLVSVFLRILEYYEGILILTSNRVGTFDEAFKSRIQVAIHYDNLTKKSRKQIWRNFFDMIEESDEDVNMPELERRLDELASEEMNGRQIRNALLTARQLAKHRKERLDWEHLSQVMKTSAAFNKYLKTIRGHSDEQWAREEMLR